MLTNDRKPINLDTLLNADRTLFQIRAGDENMPANITVAELKEIAVAVNASNERIQSLYKDLQIAEARIDKLERSNQAIADAQE